MTRLLWLILTFVVSFVLTGIPYWRPAYNVLQLPEGLLGPSALAVLALAGLCRVFAPARTLAVAGIVCAAMVVVVWVRIGMDTAIDPTTHNLLPFEIVLAAIVGLALGAIGAAGGMAIEAVLRRVRRP